MGEDFKLPFLVKHFPHIIHFLKNFSFFKVKKEKINFQNFQGHSTVTEWKTPIDEKTNIFFCNFAKEKEKLGWVIINGRVINTGLRPTAI